MEKEKFYCRDCGRLYCEQSAEYQRDFPIASLEDRERKLREHWEQCPGDREGIEFDPFTGHFVGDPKRFKRVIRDALNKCTSRHTLIEVARELLII
jgi:hypothetical protein